MSMKKRSEDTQTLHAGCSKAEPKVFAPPQTPFPGAQDGQNLNGDGHYLHLQTQFGKDLCTQFRVIVVTDPQTPTHPPTNRQDRLQYTAPLSVKMEDDIVRGAYMLPGTGIVEYWEIIDVAGFNLGVLASEG